MMEIEKWESVADEFGFALVAPEAAFVFDSWVDSAEEEGAPPSGAHLATWAFVRFLAANSAGPRGNEKGGRDTYHSARARLSLHMGTSSGDFMSHPS